MTLGEIIKARRKELKLKQTDLARELGVGRQSICEWEQGHVSNLKRRNLKKLYEVLKIPLSALLGTEEGGNDS